MTFSTKNNPKLPQSTAGITSLGAVGGARGTAAGGLRIIVEFLTTYDGGAIKQMEADLRKQDRVQTQQHGRDVARQRRLQQVRAQIDKSDLLIKKTVNTETRKQIRIIDSLHGNLTKAERVRKQTAQAELGRLLTAQGLTKSDIDLINNRTNLRKREATLVKQTGDAVDRTHQREKRRLQTQEQLTRMQQVRQQVPAKFAGLAIGAIGGILGGAVLNVGWQLADQAISAVGSRLHDIIDPARHARENVQELGKAINEIATSGNLTQLEAARQFVEGLGVSADNAEEYTKLLQEVAVRQQLIDGLKQESEIRDILKNKNTLDQETRDAIRAELIAQAKENGTYTAGLENTATATDRVAYYNQKLARSYIHLDNPINQKIDGIDVETLVTEELERRIKALTDRQYQLAESTRLAAQAAADAAALWNIYAQSLANAINAAVGLQTAGIDSQIDALGDGKSRRTRRLERQASAGSGGGGDDGGARRRQLAEIAEERALLLLKMRLKLLGTNINLEKYSGKFLMVAIEAKIAALQRESAEQEKINRLLDLRYKMSQTIERQQGESINDFLARRAQEQRNLLSEEADLRRQNQMDALEEKKDNLQDQLDLEELAQRRRDAMRAQDTAGHNNNLQKQLDASRKADAKALEAKRKALQKQKEDAEKAAQEAIALTSETAIKETYAAIRGMNSLEDMNRFSGRMSGLLRARESIQALVDGFGLPQWIAAPFLDKLNGMIAAADAKQQDVANKAGVRHLASGGIIDLKNSRATFGQNVKLGEQGDEIGVVLSNRVARILKEDRRNPNQVGPFIIQQSDDPFRDRARFGRLVRENLEAALG